MLNKVKQWFSRPKNVPQPSADQTALTPYQKMMPRKYQNRNHNLSKGKVLRNMASNGMIRIAIEHIKKGIKNLDYNIVNADPSDKKKYLRERQIIKNILEQPNIIQDFDALIDMILEDILVLDAGVVNKCKSGNPMKPLYLYPVDGTTISILEPFDYTNPNGLRYEQATNYIEKKWFTSADLGYIQMNYFTFMPYGCSPVEKIFKYFQFFIDSNDTANDVASSDTSKFLLNLGKDVGSDKMLEFRKYMSEEISGTGAIPVVAGDGVSSCQIGAINSDSLFIEWQKFLLILTAKGFSLPEKVLIGQPTNDKNTTSEETEYILQNAIKPYANLIAKMINNHVLDVLGYSFLRFEYNYAETEAQKKAKSDRINNEYVNGIITQNQALKELGYEPSKSPYADLCSTEAKAKINMDFPAQSGGFNGQGDTKDNGDAIKDSKGGGEKK